MQMKYWWLINGKEWLTLPAQLIQLFVLQPENKLSIT